MAFDLDAFPIRFTEPEAQQLHDTLTGLHTNPREALLVAQRAGVNVARIFSEQAPMLLWRDILEVASADGLTRALVQEARNLLSSNSPRRAFFDNLLANKPVLTEGEPRGADGSPAFLKDDDSVTEPEALLYRDDLTIPMGRVSALIETLQHLVALAPSVCRLVVDVNGKGQHGTGFRIGPDLLLTNWHVLHSKDDEVRATAITAEFGYEDDGEGGALAPVVVPCDVQSIVTSKEDDWAVIRAKQPLEEAWPIIKLSEAAAPTQSATAYIIQHPGGERKRVGFVRNQVSAYNERVVQYLTDTQEGSSGAPVFDRKGKIIALHHAGGRPQEVLGRAPLRKNEGIRISRVLDGLSKQQVVVP